MSARARTRRRSSSTCPELVVKVMSSPVAVSAVATVVPGTSIGQIADIGDVGAAEPVSLGAAGLAPGDGLTCSERDPAHAISVTVSAMVEILYMSVSSRA
jgi:hypothetical protein